MSPDASLSADRQSRLESIVADYLRAVDAGETTPGLQELQQCYPEFAVELAQFIEDEHGRLVQRLNGVCPDDVMRSTLTQCNESNSVQSPAIQAPDFGALVEAEQIGIGGIGVVYRARDPEFGRDLAVKTLREEHRHNESLVKRFIEEAQIGGQLQHPGIVPMHSMGQLPDGRPWFTMKLIRGETLATILADRKSKTHDVPRLLQLFELVCQTIAYAHSKRVIHRDLKPANIMVGAFGEVQVMDWGLAKVLGRNEPTMEPVRTIRSDDSDEQSRAGTVLGTWAYMSPEQARGEIDRLDERCDVFSLGAILCEILTGSPPWVSRNGLRLNAAQIGDLQDAYSGLDSCGCDSALGDLARSCLVAERDERLANAAELVIRLEQYQSATRERLHAAELERTAAVAREQETVGKLSAERKARRRAIGLGITLLLIVVGCSAAGFWYVNDQAKQKARQQREDDERARLELITDRDATAGLREALAHIDEGWRVQDKPVAWEAAVSKAFAAKRRADGVIAAGIADADLLARSAEVQRQVDQAEKMRQMAMRFDMIEMRSAILLGHFDPSDEAREWEAAFAEFGFSVRTAPDHFVQRIHGTPFVERAELALNSWGLCASDRETRRALLDVIAKLEAPFSEVDTSLFDAIQAFDLERFRSNVRRFKEIEPRVARIRKLTASLVQMGAWEEANVLLDWAIEKNADDFWLHFDLAWVELHAVKPDVEKALRNLAAAIALRAKAPFPHVLKAQALEMKGEFDDARASLVRALHLSDDDGAILVRLGSFESMRDNHERAIDYLRRGIARMKNNPFVCEALSIACNRAGRFQESLDALDRLIELHDQHRDLQANRKARVPTQNLFALTDKRMFRATLLQKLKRTEEALEQARVVVDDKSAKCDNFVSFGIILGEANRHREAIEILNRAASQWPDSFEVQFNLAASYMGSREHDKAIAAYEAAIKLQPENSLAHRHLGTAWLEKKQPMRARQAFEQAAMLDQSSATIQVKLGIAAFDLRDFAGAERAFRRAIAINNTETNFEAQWQLGLTLIQLSREEEAIKAFEDCVRHAPSRPEPFLAIADVLANCGRIRDSVAYYKNALEFEPKNVAIRTNFANALTASGQSGLAVAEYRHALEQDRFHANAWGGLGGALMEVGDFAGAKRAFEECARLLPRNDPRQKKTRELALQATNCEQLLARLDRALKGEKFDLDIHELIGFAQFCERFRNRPADAVRYYQMAFESRPVGDAIAYKQRFRLGAIICAVQATQGDGATKLTESQKLDLRQVASGWLNEEYESWKEQMSKANPQGRAYAKKMVTLGLLQNADLAAIRERQHLMKLPEPEREAWLTLWKKMEELVK